MSIGLAVMLTGQLITQGDEFIDRQGLRATPEIQWQIVEIVAVRPDFEIVAQGFAALLKALPDEFEKQWRIDCRQALVLVGAQANDGRFDFGRRDEGSGWDGED